MDPDVVGDEEVTAAFDALDCALNTVLELRFDALSSAAQLALLARCEQARRRLPAPNTN